LRGLLLVVVLHGRVGARLCDGGQVQVELVDDRIAVAQNLQFQKSISRFCDEG